MPVHPALVTSRRAVLGSVTVGLAVAPGLTGCRLGTGSDPSAPATVDQHDADLIARVVADVDRVWALVAAVGAGFPALSAPMSALQAVHEAHRQALGAPEATNAAPSAASPSAIPADRTSALALVRAGERRHQQVLVASAVSATNGALARLLASMSAAVAQRVSLGIPPRAASAPELEQPS